MQNIDSENLSDEIPQRAVSLYGQSDGADDFPVLKAFQQYIDAEQEKARKRILMLGIFFGVVLIVVVAVFMLLLYGINSRNQALSDRLVEYAMKEADRRQVPAPGTTQQNDAAFKAMTETLSALQKNIEASNRSAIQAKSENALRDIDAERETMRLQRAKNQLEIEKKQLADERERLRQIEVEQQRRKLYPELYEDSRRTSSPSRTRTLTDEDIREIIREAYPDSERREVQQMPVKKISSKKMAEDTIDVESESDDAIEYFKDDDYTIPVDVKGADSKVRFTVPVD